MKETEAGSSDLSALLSDADSLETQSPRALGSVSGAVFNICTTMVGAGIMSIPATIKVLGIIPGFAVMFMVAVLVEITVEFLLRYTQHGKSTTYAGLMAESFGSLGSLAVQISVMITNLGCLIIYLIIIGDVLCGNQSGGTLHLGVLQEWFGIHWWNSRAYVILLVVLFVMLPLVSLPHMNSLRHSSAISILLALVFIAISSAMAIYAFCKGKTQNIRLLPDFANQVSVFDLFTTVPVLVTGFSFNVNVHPIRSELSRPSDMRYAVRVSLAICLAIYFSIGFFGYMLFGDSIMADILVNFDQNSDSAIGRLINDTVRLSYAMHLALVFPVLNFSLRANIDELLFKKKPILAEDNTRFAILTCVLLTVSYIIAIVLPNIWYFFQFLGSTTVVCLSFIFPGTIVLRDVHGISTRQDKMIAILVIMLAILTSIIAIATNLWSAG
ncbi:Transmembrane amino acid transporter family protein isoform 2 [Hibiscus syriacus]|uniref:Transmembrane amino acid transporter family protein isoform 2 n=1 Tax=Hibiscus syriacus TaxID=106335 RepID=A0A6A2ZE46_HIBSY|nr:amino acid transporter AVT6C-like [Hibiscus syriacus]XP_039016586.1 amino acid transporter AVT6C-like [Hibiscus syriacus]KAE8689639.1 Transmembrane amino acid transporter family protein isoform 2 [Hibiscus syriacus]